MKTCETRFPTTTPTWTRSSPRRLASLRSVWFASFFDYDPRPAVVALSVPVLALYGELDTQVPAEGNSDGHGRGDRRVGHPPVTPSQQSPRRTTSSKQATTGSVNEYAELEPEFVPELLEILADVARSGRRHVGDEGGSLTEISRSRP